MEDIRNNETVKLLTIVVIILSAFNGLLGIIGYLEDKEVASKQSSAARKKLINNP